MAVRTVTYFATLLEKARVEVEARESGDPEAFEKAAADHDAYRQACLDSDEMVIGIRRDIF